MNCDIQKELDAIEAEFKNLITSPVKNQRAWLSVTREAPISEFSKSPEKLSKDIYISLIDKFSYSLTPENAACLFVDAIKKDIITSKTMANRFEPDLMLFQALLWEKGLGDLDIGM